MSNGYCVICGMVDCKAHVSTGYAGHRKGFELVATCPVPIVSMVMFHNRLFVATGNGVYERGDDGVFRECRFEPAQPAQSQELKP